MFSRCETIPCISSPSSLSRSTAPQPRPVKKFEQTQTQSRRLDKVIVTQVHKLEEKHEQNKNKIKHTKYFITIITFIPNNTKYTFNNIIFT